MNKIFVEFNKAIDLIQEGDILLIRGDSSWSWLLKRAGESEYTHVGLATWHNGRKKDENNESLLEITEFRENIGGRTVDLARAYNYHIRNRNIDVYRVSDKIQRLYFDPRSHQLLKQEIKFNGKAITNYVRSLTGLPYGWQKIFWLFKNKILKYFWTFKSSYDDSLAYDPTLIYPVCSTAVAAAYSRFGYDLVNNKSDEFVEPGDLGRSSLTNYLFTLTS